MKAENVINSNLNIITFYDDDGRKYYKLNIAFSDNDMFTIARHSMDELLDDLPQVIVSAVQARLIRNSIVCQ